MTFDGLSSTLNCSRGLDVLPAMIASDAAKNQPSFLSHRAPLT